MYDGSAIAAAELRFREDLWRTAPSDAVEEAGVRTPASARSWPPSSASCPRPASSTSSKGRRSPARSTTATSRRRSNGCASGRSTTGCRWPAIVPAPAGGRVAGVARLRARRDGPPLRPPGASDLRSRPASVEIRKLEAARDRRHEPHLRRRPRPPQPGDRPDDRPAPAGRAGAVTPPTSRAARWPAARCWSPASWPCSASTRPCPSSAAAAARAP